ncbi:MAG: alanine dehydrogenase [Cellvibrionaceae bacterium]|jgi:alanine dehydrogenase
MNPMIIGVPTEIKALENRVGCTPAGVAELVRHGHTVLVESGAGNGSGFSDAEYAAAGATITAAAADVWAADMVCKVKEPLASEYGYFRDDLLLFTYLHLAAEGALTKALIDAGTTGIAYETVQIGRSLPLLTPMSEVAGRMSVELGAHYLKRAYGGKGILLGGVPGVRPGTVTIIGGGVSGINAAKMAIGLGARVLLLDISADRLKYLDDVFGARIETVMSNSGNIAEAVAEADLLVGAVLIPGAAAPKLVTEDMVKTMSAGSVIVDIAIDQGGCIETVDRVTYHDNPTYIKHDVVHYSVGNMPGAVPRTSTMALTNVTLPYAVKLANMGAKGAMAADASLRIGLNTMGGNVTHEGVATSLGYDFVAPESLIN